MPSLRTVVITATLLGGCGGGTPPATNPTPTDGRAPIVAPARALLTTGYSATATLDRRDSILISLPDGRRQLQRVVRHLRFAVEVRRGGDVVVRLDSVAVTPTTQGQDSELVGTSWRGTLDPSGLRDLRTATDGRRAAFLTSIVAQLFPALPRNGALEGEQWGDTTTSELQVEIFAADDHRRSTWSVGPRTERDGIEVIAVRANERYEQVGRGDQAGREMRMSAQGSRNATYYLTIGGRVDGMVQTDSAQRLITIPSTQQAVPTIQVVRTVVRWALVVSR